MSLELGCRRRLLETEDGRQAIRLLDTWEEQITKWEGWVEALPALTAKVAALSEQLTVSVQWTVLREITQSGWRLQIQPVDALDLQRGWEGRLDNEASALQVRAEAPTFDGLGVLLVQGWRQEIFRKGQEAMP